MVDRDQGDMKEDNHDHSRKSVHESMDARSCGASQDVEGMDLQCDDKNTWYDYVSIRGYTSRQ